MRRMLINATHQNEEMRVAMVDGQRLYDLDIELAGREQKKGNIYKGKVTRVEPSLEAAFVDYGAERHGFLPLKEVVREYMHNPPQRGRPSIKDALKEGQEIIVQIDKEERGNKGAALTTSISLAGSYMVLMPNNSRAGGISRRIAGEERTELKSIINQLQVPNGMGCIVRTAGVGKSFEEINYDFGYLLEFWKNIKSVADNRPAPFLISQESDVITRAIRDYLRPDIGEIIVDRKEAYERIKSELTYQRPDFINKVKLYKDEIPLFNRYQIESQIESAFQREVRLPSGGSVVFDQTEALLSIDINSSKATKGSDIEETALYTNIEAAEEIARQLRLRDIGGLIVIDFIDMGPPRNQRQVEQVLKESVARDRARIQIGRISKFGLLEMSRQRLRPSLEESSQHVCPRCTGSGVIRGTDSLALSILRLMEDEAMKESTAEVQAILPVEVATFLLNEKRRKIEQIEKRQKVKLIVVPNPYMETPHYEVLRVKSGETLEDSSYSLIGAAPNIELVKSTTQMVPISEQPALQGMPTPTTPAPVASKRPEKKKPSLFKRLWDALFGKEDKDKKKKSERHHSKKYSKHQRGKNNRYQGKKPNKANRQQNAKVQDKDEQKPQAKKVVEKQQNKPSVNKQRVNKPQPSNHVNKQQEVVEKRPARKTRAERLALVEQNTQPNKPIEKQSIPQAKQQTQSKTTQPEAQDLPKVEKQAQPAKAHKEQTKKAPKPKVNPEEVMVYKAQKSLERSISDVMGYNSKTKADTPPQDEKPVQNVQSKPSPEVEKAPANDSEQKDTSFSQNTEHNLAKGVTEITVSDEAVTHSDSLKAQPSTMAQQAEPVKTITMPKIIGFASSAPVAKASNLESIAPIAFTAQPYNFEGKTVTNNHIDPRVDASSSPAAKTNID